MFRVLLVKFTNGRLDFSLFSLLFSLLFSTFIFLEHKVRVSDGHKSQVTWKDVEGSRRIVTNFIQLVSPQPVD